ncbi:hypothetical protein BYT27DRAFT_7256339 [Phlegmacium glaucopus]|nr:hypothetical protein BYT27DRAFT_7256339 [Phlegmacium glaucopus]
MFSRSSGLVFLAISLCVQAVPHFHQEHCSPISTVTVTINSASPTTHAGHNNDNSGGFTNPTQHGVDANNDGHGSTTAKARASSTKIASTAASTHSVSNAGNTRTKSGNNSNDPQTSLTLDPRVIAKGFANDGQDVPSPGQVKSLTSTNNFINFCLTVSKLPITNGKQIATGSCNPAPMGLIPSSNNMPSSKFTFPKNFSTLKANQSFTIEMAIRNMQTGFFVNAEANYFAAPQQLNAQGQIQGHSHVVIEELSSLDQTTPTSPKNFVFFKGLNAAAANGKLSATVPTGLNVGFYKLSSINTASNHQPILVPIAQHGSLDDAIYFSVTSDGVAVTNGGKNAAPITGTGRSTAHRAASTTARAAVATSLSTTAAAASTHASKPHNIAPASVPLSQNSGLPASDNVLSSATVRPTSATLVPGISDDKGPSSTSSFIPVSTSLASMKGKREFRSHFTLKF